MDNRFTVFEVGPRDGLQNEPVRVPLADKVHLVAALLKAGIRNLELGAFVRPDLVPQMADTDKMYELIRTGKLPFGKARAWCLVPNRKGLDRALQGGARNIAVFTAATDSFSRRNIGMSVRDSLVEYAEVVRDARERTGGKIHVRGYISTAFGCPFEGKVAPSKTLRVIEKLLRLGINEISVGDTIGVATPKQVEAVVRPALRIVGKGSLAGHFHDTRGTALANALRSIELGVRTLDSSAGGLGGCPFAPGASGNLATEDLVYMLQGLGFKTGIDLPALCEASLNLYARIGKPLVSKYLQSYVSECQTTRK